MESSKIAIEKFDGTDFGFWKMQIEDYLYQKGLHEPLLGEKPESMTAEKWMLKDRQALGLIRLTLSRNVAFNIVKEKTTADLLKALANMYEKPSAVNKVYLMRRLFNLQMTEGGSVADHINGFNMIVSQLSSVEINFEDEIKALILMSSLPESWDSVVVAISSSRGSEKLTFDEIRDVVLSESIRKRELGDSSGSALSVDRRGRSKSRTQNTHGRSKSKNRGKSPHKPNVTCWNCGDKGHFKTDCKKPKKKQNQKSGDDNDSVNSAEDNEDALILSVDSPVESWILDSGASFHSSPSKELFRNFKSGNFGKVYLADNKALEIEGKGDVCIHTPTGNQWTLHDVRYIPGLKKNLISVGQLDSTGYAAEFGQGSWKIVKGAMVVARGTKSGTLYTTAGCINMAAVAEGDSSSCLWHNRLGHMSAKGMKMLVSKGVLKGLKSVDMSLCESCVMGKQKRVSFTKVAREPKKVRLDMVHTDVWGPSPVSSVGGSRFYVTFIDDFSRKVWVYFLKHKSDVFATFKRWKAEVENQTGLKIKCLRSDNGGEYDKSEFKALCAAEGIRMMRTVPGKARQNGVAERMNRTLNERARSMRIHSGLPKMFWADAVSTAAYLINRGPSVPLGFKIPEEVWTGKELKYSHLRTFGCTAYVHVDPEKRDKLDAKAVKCYFIGYGSDMFGYRFWDDKSRKILRHCDVTFDETVLYKDKDMMGSESAKQVGVEVELQNSSPGDVEIQSQQTPEAIAVEPEEEQVTPEQVLRRSSRTIRTPDRFSPSLHYLLLTDEGEPESFDEALQVEDSIKWEQAMDDEMSSLEKNNTWVLTELPAGKRALLNKWVFRIKAEPDGKRRFKARLVVKGYSQRKGIDYAEIFSPVVKLTTIRILLSIVASENLHLEQMDVKTAFLHGDLDKEIYMQQPEGFVVPGKEHMVCKLTRSLYGLKQAPRQWYMKFDSFMCKSGFHRSEKDQCCYFKKYTDSYVLLLLYVDDMLIAGSSMKEINFLKASLSSEFEMKDLGAAKQILGMRISRDRSAGILNLSQEQYIEKVLSRFKVNDAKPRTTPLANHLKLSKGQSPKTAEEREHMALVPYASAVGSLMYAMVCTRPDIAHAVGVVSRYMSNPGKEHWEAVKWLLRYLRGTSSTSLCYRKGKVILQGFVDADLSGDVDSSKSTSGYVYTIDGTAVSWMSRLQKCVALSSTEAEYVAISEAGKEMIWLADYLEELGRKQLEKILYTDSQSAIQLVKNPVYHLKTKHIRRRYHFTRRSVEDGDMCLEKIEGARNPADMLTKCVDVGKLRLCKTLVGLL